MRISARFDEDRSQKLEFLRSATQLGTSEILKRALDVYFDQYRCARPAEILRGSGFVGSGGDADPELSTRYKDELKEVLRAKHDHR